MKKILIISLIVIFITGGLILLYQNQNSILSLLKEQNNSSNTIQGKPPQQVVKPNHQQVQMILQQKLMNLQGGGKPVQMMLTEDEKQQVVEQAIQELKFAEHFEDRELAVLTLAAFPERNTIQALILALDDPVTLVRQQAVMQMMYWPDQEQRNEFLLNALNNEDPGVVGMSLEFVDATLVSKEALHAKIVELSHSNNEEVATIATMALSEPQH